MKRILALIAMLCLSTTAASANTLMVLGDSLSAAFGLDREQGWVHLLQEKLVAEQSPWQVVNASISGETSAGGLQRLPALLSAHRPEIIAIVLGANDGLQGKPPALLKRNLLSMVELARQADSKVLIVGNRIPPNYGEQYTRMIFESFEQVAKDTDSHYLPWLLAAVAEQRELFQADQLHPTAEAQPLIMNTVWPALRPLLIAD